MYEFVDATEQAPTDDRLPSVAMKFDGNFLENEIDGYQTLRVGGRETIGVELTADNTNIGTLTTDSRLPHREMTVTYQLKADDNTEFQQKFKELRKFLTTDDQIPIKFIDEPNTVYFGRLSSMATPDDSKNNIVSTFTVYCDSPYKFSELETSHGSIGIDTFYTTMPERILLEVGNTTNNIEITNGIEHITATGTFNAGSEVIIEFNQDETKMLVDGVVSTYMLDLQSDLENFELREGDTVSSEQGTITVEMRERWL